MWLAGCKNNIRIWYKVKGVGCSVCWVCMCHSLGPLYSLIGNCYRLKQVKSDLRRIFYSKRIKVAGTAGTRNE